MYRCWWQVDGAEGVYGIFLLLQFLDGVRSKDINKTNEYKGEDLGF